VLYFSIFLFQIKIYRQTGNQKSWMIYKTSRRKYSHSFCVFSLNVIGISQFDLYTFKVPLKQVEFLYRFSSKMSNITRIDCCPCKLLTFKNSTCFNGTLNVYMYAGSAYARHHCVLCAKYCLCLCSFVIVLSGFSNVHFPLHWILSI
jgi:hypothetical protein